MKCANCDKDAMWVYDPPASDATPFCEAHLPGFLRKPARDGLLTTTESYAATQTAVAEALAPKRSTRKKSDPVEESVEEPVEA